MFGRVTPDSGVMVRGEVERKQESISFFFHHESSLQTKTLTQKNAFKKITVACDLCCERRNLSFFNAGDRESFQSEPRCRSSHNTGCNFVLNDVARTCHKGHRPLAK